MVNLNKKLALQVATFAALFGLMTFFMDMMEETEKQVTYSVTLESLLHAQSETNGENGGGTTDGETGGGCTCPNNPGTYYEGYKNKTKIIRNFNGDISSYMRGRFIVSAGLSITVGASGRLTYCKSVFWWWKKCYKELNGWLPFNN